MLKFHPVDKAQGISDFKKALSQYGYKINDSNKDDVETANAVRAFNIHYVPRPDSEYDSYNQIHYENLTKRSDACLNHLLSEAD